MQGRESLEIPKASTPILSLDDEENSDQKPSFENHSNAEGAEDSSQLEGLQNLLEISHRNEKLAKQRTSEALEEFKKAEEKLSIAECRIGDLELSQQEANKALLNVNEKCRFLAETLLQNQDIIKALTEERDAAVELSKNLLVKIDQVQADAQSRDAVMQLALQDVHVQLEKSISENKNESDALKSIIDDHKEESAQHKRVILKQDQTLKKKTKEIAELTERVSVLEQYAVSSSPAQFNKTHFFKAADQKKEYNSEIIPTTKQKNAKI